MNLKEIKQKILWKKEFKKLPIEQQEEYKMCVKLLDISKGYEHRESVKDARDWARVFTGMINKMIYQNLELKGLI